MSKIDELIERLCPEGITYKRMGDVGEFVRGSGLPKSDFTASGVGCIHYGQIYTYYGTYTEKTKSFVSPELAKKLKKVQHGDLIIASTSENIQDVCKSVAWLGEEEIVTGGHATIFKHKENPKYLSYLTQTDFFSDLKKKYAKGIKVTDVSAKDMAKFEIPIPPLEIQNEIVSILDNFTLLEAELEAELEARKKQYEHYRATLLSFDSKNVEWKTLGEICTLITKGTTPKAYTENGVSFIKTESFDGTRIVKSRLSFVSESTHLNYLKRSILEAGDILFTIAGATIGKTAVVTEDILPANTNQALAIIRLSKTVNKRYIFNILRSDLMRQYINITAKGSAQPNLNLQQLNSFRVPLPSPFEQERIVNLLDKFETLVNDISIGLPAEIKARRKQYEYYRNKLLTFKNVSNG